MLLLKQIPLHQTENKSSLCADEGQTVQTASRAPCLEQKQGTGPQLKNSATALAKESFAKHTS